MLYYSRKEKHRRNEVIPRDREDSIPRHDGFLFKGDEEYEKSQHLISVAAIKGCGDHNRLTPCPSNVGRFSERGTRTMKIPKK